MKKEMNWMSIWILMNSVMTLLIITYFYLNQEIEVYFLPIMVTFTALTLLPYVLWKYNQMKFVEKRTIVIQILKD